ncbi:MAG: PRC-barrel domain-containing protein [Candidatus Aenigmatarchaeota archaeon]
MAVTIKRITDLFDKDVFTTRGQYCGRVKDVEIDLQKGRVKSIVVEAAKGTLLEAMLGGKKAVVVPYSLISAFSDIVLIKFELSELKKALPETEATETTKEQK